MSFADAGLHSTLQDKEGQGEKNICSHTSLTEAANTYSCQWYERSEMSAKRRVSSRYSFIGHPSGGTGGLLAASIA